MNSPFPLMTPTSAAAQPGMADFSAFSEFAKALEAGYGTDHASLTGGGSLRLESLEAVLMSIVQSNQHFRLFNSLKKSAATATVDEWTEHSDVGGRVGGAFNTELGTIANATGTYARKIGLVKYLMTRRSVSFVQTLQNALAPAVAQEQVAGTMELLSSAEWASFYGNSDIVAEEFDGVKKAIDDLGSSDHVINMAGARIDPLKVIQGAATIASFGNFGRPTDAYCSQGVQGDLDNYLDAAFRVGLDQGKGSVEYGAPVTAIRTSFGNIKMNPDVFIRESKLPLEAEKPTLVTTSAPTAPVSVTVAAGAHASSEFVAADAGSYWYAVASVAKGGETGLVYPIATLAIVAGERVTITITRPVAADATGYAIYRGRKNVVPASASDYRLVRRVADSGAATTVVYDTNSDIPGTSEMFLLNQDPALNAIGWRQLLPLTKFQLYPTNSAEVPWAQLLFGYLRVTKAKQHVYIKNILPDNNSWDPRG